MSATAIIATLLVYFAILIVIARITSRGADNQSFYLGNKKSPWYVVAFGMIGASLSGVTFISVPGWVEGSQFSYMQMVLGYLVGYFVIANVLLPLYYKLNLTSIYGYLLERLGMMSYKTGASFFLLSRIIGASFRLFLVAMVLEDFVMKPLGLTEKLGGELPAFSVAVIVTVALIWVYTNRGGIKTIIWTDMLQTACLLGAAIAAFFAISSSLDFSFGEAVAHISDSPQSKTFFFSDFSDSNHFIKKFLTGAFIAIAMTGLDQDMMQKNLSCKNLKEAKKNMYWLSLILVPVNLLFLGLGVLLYSFANANGIEASGDSLFPTIAISGGLGIVIGLTFVIGLVASAYSSADSALTALTTSFCVDILGTERKGNNENSTKLRRRVHIAMSGVLVVVIILFKLIDDPSIIATMFKVAGYTYGPLLGLYAFGLFTKRKVIDTLTPVICILCPAICLVLNYTSEYWLFGYKFGFELLIVNGLLTFIGLLAISSREKKITAPLDAQ
jgi:SSS family solute:Na+ symporter